MHRVHDTLQQVLVQCTETLAFEIGGNIHTDMTLTQKSIHLDRRFLSICRRPYHLHPIHSVFPSMIDVAISCSSVYIELPAADSYHAHELCTPCVENKTYKVQWFAERSRFLKLCQSIQHGSKFTSPIWCGLKILRIMKGVGTIESAYCTATSGRSPKCLDVHIHNLVRTI